MIYKSFSYSRRGRARSGPGWHGVGLSVHDPFTKLEKFILFSPRRAHVQDCTTTGAQIWDSSIGLSDCRAELPLNDFKRGKYPQERRLGPKKTSSLPPWGTSGAQEEGEGTMGQNWWIAQVHLQAHPVLIGPHGDNSWRLLSPYPMDTNSRFCVPRMGKWLISAAFVFKHVANLVKFMETMETYIF